MAQKPHFLLVAYPVHGHLNPALRFAKRLIQNGATATLTTTIAGHRRMSKTLIPDGLSFATFSDGYDDGFISSHDATNYMSELRRRGTEALANLIETSKKEGRPFNCLVYTLLLTWAAKVACAFHLPSALLWIQPATVFNVYFYYSNGYRELFDNNSEEPSWSLELPGLPRLCRRDLPSFLIHSDTYPFILPAFEEQMLMLSKEENPTVLVNTLDALEPLALTAIPNLKMVAIGPLVPPSAFGAVAPKENNSYMEWLDSKSQSSVVYISFGTIAVLTEPQLKELAQGLILFGRPFMWVITDKQNGDTKEKEIDKIVDFRQELDRQGLVLSWCSQVEVLSHKSIGCFVTHCGWNSSLESLVMGVPVVAFPQWTDQTTNAKLIEDSWGTGVRVRENEEGIVEAEEIKRCLEVVMEGVECRGKAKEWRGIALEATKESGSSDKNLKAFVADLLHAYCN